MARIYFITFYIVTLVSIKCWWLKIKIFVKKIFRDYRPLLRYIAQYIVNFFSQKAVKIVFSPTKICCCPQVVLQVVIAFIVDAFVLQLQQDNQKKIKQKKKILERSIYVAAPDDTDCIEGECTSVRSYKPSINNSVVHTMSCTWLVSDEVVMWAPLGQQKVS